MSRSLSYETSQLLSHFMSVVTHNADQRVVHDTYDEATLRKNSIDDVGDIDKYV